MARIKLPETCPVCGASWHGGNLNDWAMYECGCKVWIDDDEIIIKGCGDDIMEEEPWEIFCREMREGRVEYQDKPIMLEDVSPKLLLELFLGWLEEYG